MRLHPISFAVALLWGSQIIYLMHISWVVLQMLSPCEGDSCIVVSDSLWPMDCNLPGSSVLRISQARILEWVAVLFSRGYSWSMDGTQVSCTAGRLFIVWATQEASQITKWKKLATWWSWAYSPLKIDIMNTCDPSLLPHRQNYAQADHTPWDTPLSPGLWNCFAESHRGVWVFWALAVLDILPDTCNKHCTFLHRNLGLLDWWGY